MWVDFNDTHAIDNLVYDIYSSWKDYQQDCGAAANETTWTDFIEEQLLPALQYAQDAFEVVLDDAEE